MMVKKACAWQHKGGQPGRHTQADSAEQKGELTETYGQAIAQQPGAAE